MTKILIVEDEEAISDLIKMSLTKAGYHCEQAMDGLEAADCIENNNYDLILLDIMLPEINGYELLEYIKTKETPVIFITAMGELNDRVKGLRAGADDYITKPFEMIELLARVETDFCGVTTKWVARLRFLYGNWMFLRGQLRRMESRLCLRSKSLNCFCFLCAIKILLCIVKQFMKIYGKMIIWVTAVP